MRRRNLLRQESRTKLLIILTDGRPYDHDYGDARYAREDVREALTEAKMSGITPFCITVDRESEGELKDLYGDVGYTIIDDVLAAGTNAEHLPQIDHLTDAALVFVTSDKFPFWIFV